MHPSRGAPSKYTHKPFAPDISLVGSLPERRRERSDVGCTLACDE